jgi:hypothetical protein
VSKDASDGRNHAQQHGVLIGNAVSLVFMKTRIEDLPVIRVSALVASGYISRDAVTALVRFGDDRIEPCRRQSGRYSEMAAS